MIRTIYLMAITSYVVSFLFPHQPVFKLFVSVLCMLAVGLSLQRVRGLALSFGAFFLGIGSLMLVVSHAKAIQFITSFGEMIQMVTLFALIPILSFPIRYGHYADEIRELIRRKVTSRSQFYVLTSIISFFFSSFMNLGALPLTYHSIAPSTNQFEIAHKKRYLSCAITHGYAMPLLWSPITPIVGTVLYLTKTAYSQVFPYLIILSIAGLVLDWATSKGAPGFMNKARNEAEQEIAVTQTSSVVKELRLTKLWQIVGTVLLLNGLVTVLDHFFTLSFLFLVSLIVLPFAFSWCFLIGETRSFLSGLHHHFHTYIPQMQNQFFIFLTAGFFITALHVSHADRMVTHAVDTLIQFTGLRLFLIVLPLIPFALAFLGLHPAVGLALISEALRSQVLLVAPVVVTVAMLGGAIPAFLMGPYNATLGMMSALIHEKPFTLSHWNAPFTWRYLILLTLFVQFMYNH
ncbi:hypothetical protein [Sporolactobacillus nakayamae]|uniref:hypothetical protein n=1 Tax=Sporolactobacillus nakayamae TaxID=269670 RepID=UPI000B85642E|nr:hypothetical protein [Sporolactobacillus nakayamae]